MDFFSGALGDFHFLRPLWLLCLLPALLLVMALWRINETSTAWDKAIDKSLLPWLLDRRKNASERTPLLLLLVAWCAATIALAGPVWERIPQPVQKRQDALVIVMDMSLSMFANDYEPNRLTVAKRKLQDILAMRPEGQTALVVYAGDAHTVTPLTEDSVTISALAPSLSPNIMPAFGSNPVSGIERALTLLNEAGASSGRVLLITDGIEESDGAAIRNLLAGTPYGLSVLGIGTPDGAPIPASAGDFLRDGSGNVVIAAFDSEPLEELTDRLNGRYAGVELSSDDLEHVLSDADFRNDENLTETGESFDVWADAGPWLLLLVLPLSALIFRRGWILTLLFGSTLLSGVFVPAKQVQAADWEDIWKTQDQQAAEAFANEDPATAAALFESPEWRGTAAYRAGDYQAAIEAFSQSPNVQSLYNLGNSYARAELLPEALQAYEAVLAQQPDHADALHNKKIVEDLLEQQEQEQQEQQQQQQQQNEEQQEAQNEPDPNETNPQEEQPEQEGQQSDQPPEGEPQEQEQDPQNQNRPPDQSTEALEDQESLEQWLRRIDDEPGELLQRKFQFEYRRRQLENRNSGNRPVERQIW